MKNKILLFSALILLFSGNLSSKETEVTNNIITSPQGIINVMSSPDLYNLTLKWANEYSRLHPGLKVNVINTTDFNKENLLKNGVNIGFISNDYYSPLNQESIWKMVIGRDVIVPVINSKNPFLNEIYQQGISAKALAQFIQSPEKQNWGTLLNNGQNIPVKYYLINDASLKSGIANYLNIKLNIINGIATQNSSELILKLQNDPYAIGFCKINNVLNQDEQSIVESIKLLPIDRNANGRLDYMEKIYDDFQVFQRGVWIGKYPKALCSNIYSISSVKPENEAELGLLKWVMADGQKYLTTYGYNDLVYSERQSQIENLAPAISYSTPAKGINNITKVAIIVLTSFIVLLLILDSLSRYFRSKKLKASNAELIFPNVFNESSVNVPKGLFYDKTHTWAFMEADGIVKIGIDDFFQHITGPLTSIKMKNPGEKVKKGEQVFSIIQKGKQLNIYAPISGTIKAQNNLLNSDSSLINSSPYKDGWVYMIEPTNWLRDIQFLVMADNYTQWIKKEFSRLKDFLAINIRDHKVEYAHVMLQDGGELKDCVLEDLGPEVWEDFQTNFIDSFK